MTERVISSSGSALHREGKQALLSRHYLKRLPSISHAFCVWRDDLLVAVVTFGVPPSRHLQQSACPTRPDAVLELNRLWVRDGEPKNTASRIVSLALKMLPAAIIVSYADTAVGHAGYVYRACNFFYAGWTDMERKTPRLDYIPAATDDGGFLDQLGPKHSRDAFRSGEFTRVRRQPKVKYWTVSGNRRERHEMQAIAGWPKLDWKTQPPPMPEIADV